MYVVTLDVCCGIVLLLFRGLTPSRCVSGVNYVWKIRDGNVAVRPAVRTR